MKKQSVEPSQYKEREHKIKKKFNQAVRMYTYISSKKYRFKKSAKKWEQKH